MSARRKKGTVPLPEGKENRNIPFLIERSLSRLVPGWPDARLCVALSGGADSVVLLASCAALRAERPALALRAIHVHHGLQPEADAWQSGCEALCGRLDVALDVARIDLAPAAGESVEAQARAARYAALSARLAPGEALLTAHHQDDQLETVLLQLMRGAGVAGLAAMPEVAPLGRGLHLRPLLGVPRATIEAWARQQRLAWVEDPMNASERFDRGFLRARVTPALRSRWPTAGRTVARSARYLAEAQGLLDELAAIDAAAALDGKCLRAAALRALPAPRQANLLRWWLRERGLGTPPSRRLAATLGELLGARPDGAPVLRWDGGEVRRYRDRLYAMTPLVPPPPQDWSQPLLAGASVALPRGLGWVRLESVTAGGFRLPLESASPTVRFRCGGEQLRPTGQQRRRTLKNLYQEAGIVPWMRRRIPLVECGGRLLAVGNLWIEADAAAGPGEQGWRLAWSDGPACR